MNERVESRVLVVEDDPGVRLHLQRALARKRIVCDLAVDGVEADELLAKKKYDIILSDLRMPRKHGHKLIVEILAAPAPPIIIAFTGVVDNKIIADLFERGVDDVLMKPLPYELVAMKVKSLLAKVKSRRGTLPRDDIAQQIERTTTNLKQQLSDVQNSFEETIRQLERSRDELEAGYLDSVRVLTGLMEQLGKFEGSHSVRVEKMAVAMGQDLRLARKDLHALKIASLLHEIGQFGMPDSIRSKAPWELEAADMDAFRNYPLIGATLLSEIRGVESVVEVIREHTENYDGTGIPEGKAGEHICLLARIVRIADGLDTYLMHGISGDPHEAASKHLLSMKGKQYDPDLVALAIKYSEIPVDAISEQRIESIHISRLDEGFVLADNVYDEYGRFLARKGAILTRSLLNHLKLLLGAQKVKVFVHDAADATVSS